MDYKALLKYITALLLFGTNGIIASHILLSSYEIVFLRTGIGSILLIVLFLLGHGTFQGKAYKKDMFTIVLSGISMGASWMFLYEAYQQIGVSLSSLLYYCGPVLVMILSPLLFRERLTAAKILGFTCVFIGIFLVNGKMTGNTLNTWGLFCGGMSALMYSCMVIFNKLSKHISGLENAVLQLVVSFLTVAVFVGIKQGFLLEIPANAWPSILFLGLVNTGIGCYLYFSPLSKLSVQTVAILGYLEPLSAVFFAVLLLGETMNSIQIVGAVLILGGAMFGELVKGKNTDTHKSPENSIDKGRD